MQTLSEAAASQPAQTDGLSTTEAQRRLAEFGPNAIHAHRFTIFGLLLRQFKNPILILLSVAAALSATLGDHGNALTIAVILAVSVLLSLNTEYRAEKASADLQKRATHSCAVKRDGGFIQVEVTQLVPGDLVRLTLGAVVPADLRLVEVQDLEIDESIVTGESMPVSKSSDVGDPTENCALMGTVVRAGSGLGLVVRTGGSTEFGEIAKRLSEQVPETDFQRGLRQFSVFLLRIAIVMAVLVVGVNALLHRNVIDSVLFALALAVGLTPQLLPAIVSTALALGSRQLAKFGVLVKRLVSIEDLGDMDVLLTDKTGTLTEGAVAFQEELALSDRPVAVLALFATDADYTQASKSTAGLNPLDAALWSSAELLATANPLPQKLDAIAFDHNRRIASVLLEFGGERLLVAKGSPEDLLARCRQVGPTVQKQLDTLYSTGARVVAVASKPMPAARTIKLDDERDLRLDGFVTFADPIKPDVRKSLAALAALGIQVKIATGDSAQVAQAVCRSVGLAAETALTGTEIDNLDDASLASAVEAHGIFARVSPEQKARILRALRANGKAIGFLGDGVNDAIALHDADVGISVDSAADVAKDAADVVLLEKDLGVLAAGVRHGRRVFSNTMKYVLMGTAGDFGNMISAAIGSMILPFLPMLPSQVLLQDLLYDSSQLTIPVDRVDAEQVARPSHWRIAFIRKFMIVFGLASSIFDFATFGLMLWGFNAKASEFQTGWFVESLASATLIVFAVRTRRVPFLRSRPSWALAGSVLTVVAIGIGLTYSQVGVWFGFSALPLPFFGALLGMIAAYLVVVEVAKWRLFKADKNLDGAPRPNLHVRDHSHRVNRRAAKFAVRTGRKLQ